MPDHEGMKKLIMDSRMIFNLSRLDGDTTFIESETRPTTSRADNETIPRLSQDLFFESPSVLELIDAQTRAKRLFHKFNEVEAPSFSLGLTQEFSERNINIPDIDAKKMGENEESGEENSEDEKESEEETTSGEDESSDKEEVSGEDKEGGDDEERGEEETSGEDKEGGDDKESGEEETSGEDEESGEEGASGGRDDNENKKGKEDEVEQEGEESKEEGKNEITPKRRCLRQPARYVKSPYLLRCLDPNSLPTKKQRDLASFLLSNDKKSM